MDFFISDREEKRKDRPILVFWTEKFAADNFLHVQIEIGVY